MVRDERVQRRGVFVLGFVQDREVRVAEEGDEGAWFEDRREREQAVVGQLGLGVVQEGVHCDRCEVTWYQFSLEWAPVEATRTAPLATLSRSSSVNVRWA